MKNIATIIVILLIGFGVYYFANEYAVTRQISEQMMDQYENGGTDSQDDSVSGDVAPGTTPGARPTIQGKININEVCQGALIYMTFTDGAAAEKFVAECKEGKHPEVIEQFKANLNLGDGAQI